MVCVVFFWARMLVKGAASGGGVTRRDEPMGYWGIVVAKTALIAFLIYVLVREHR